MKTLLEEFPDLLLILVPRHPERFRDVRERVERAGFEVVSRTDGRACRASVSVFLGDTMGEVPLFYAASDIAFVGGSLVPIGGAGTFCGCVLVGMWIFKLNVEELTPSLQRKTAHHPLPGNGFSYRLS